MSKTGVVYLKVKLELEMDIDEEDVQELVHNLDYEVSGGLVDGVNLVQNTEIVDCGTDFSMTRIPPLRTS